MTFTDDKIQDTLADLSVWLTRELNLIDVALDLITEGDPRRWVYGRQCLVDRRRERLRMIEEYDTLLNLGLNSYVSLTHETNDEEILARIATITAEIRRSIEVNLGMREMTIDTIDLIESGWM